MRSCATCGLEDAPQVIWIDRCDCKSMAPDLTMPNAHNWLCSSLSHRVIRYAIPLRVKGKGPEETQRLAQELFAKQYGQQMALRGGLKYELVQNPNAAAFNTVRFAARTHLCQDCIAQYEQQQRLREDYERLRKASLPENYYHMICND